MDRSPGWGLPYQVIEDQGTGKINQTTTTSAYDRDGRATHVTDATGRTFETNSNQRGQIEGVVRTDPSPDVPIVSYTYGSSGVTNGLVAPRARRHAGAPPWSAALRGDRPGEGGLQSASV